MKVEQAQKILNNQFLDVVKNDETRELITTIDKILQQRTLPVEISFVIGALSKQGITFERRHNGFVLTPAQQVASLGYNVELKRKGDSYLLFCWPSKDLTAAKEVVPVQAAKEATVLEDWKDDCKQDKEDLASKKSSTQQILGQQKLATPNSNVISKPKPTSIQKKKKKKKKKSEVVKNIMGIVTKNNATAEIDVPVDVGEVKRQVQQKETIPDAANLDSTQDSNKINGI